MSASVRGGRAATTIPPRATARPNNAFGAMRPAVLSAARLLLIPLASAAPLTSLFPRHGPRILEDDEDLPKDPDDPGLWIYLSVAIFLVLLGGVFAGLTIALMGQDETYLQVIATSGDGSERRHAEKVLKLLNKGKHWVLVTLLLSNVITNETLPIVLDRSLGGGWPAVVSSTVLIGELIPDSWRGYTGVDVLETVIFGEIAPQSVCVRYGLSIGAFMAPFVLILMWLMCPVAWPTAKLLDWLLGEDHGTMYKKAGLKTLVTLHKTLGTGAGERLMEDEVTIINSVLDLKEKPVGDIMTPMQDVFTMSADTILDERMMDTILSQGYSRIPIYAPENPRNFIGMLLVKILITYDPEDCKRVRDFALATLPETAPHTSCLDIINFFQEGKSHMVLVSDFPGQDKGALGVVTLEDVIEELIGEEIIDESDVFVDVHKAIRRMAPAPKTRFSNRQWMSERDRDQALTDAEDGKEPNETEPLLKKDDTGSRKTSLANGQTTFLMRRKSSAASDNPRDAPTVPVRTRPADMKEHLKHLGPSNAASHPRQTKFTSVKIKPGVGTIPENRATTKGAELEQTKTNSTLTPSTAAIDHANDNADVNSLRGKSASGGAAAVYGTMGSPMQSARRMSADDKRPMSAHEASQVAKENTATSDDRQDSGTQSQSMEPLEPLKLPDKLVVGKDATAADDDDDTVGELGASTYSNERSKKRLAARSGSITETTVDAGGLKKVVLETTSSSEDGTQSPKSTRDGGGRSPMFFGSSKQEDEEEEDSPSKGGGDSGAQGENGEGGKRRKKRGKRKKGSQ